MANNQRNRGSKSFQGSRKKSRSKSRYSKSSDRDNRPSKNEMEKDDQSFKGTDNRGYSNDPSWWMKAGNLSKDTSSISTLQPVGYMGPAIDTVHAFYTPAGVARYDYVPFFGDISSEVHPINVAAKLMYDQINSKNSRNTQYDPSDLMIYTLAAANAWALHACVLRIVGMFNTYSVLNRYWWTPLARTMGLSANATSLDIVAWRNLANRMALKLNMLSVPNTISYFSRVIMLPSGIYADSPSQKASLFYFMPYALLRYDYDSEGLSMLRESKCPWTQHPGSVTPNMVEEYFNGLVENLFNDSDVNMMGADIIKAYGMENCFRLPQISEDYTTMFMYDPAVNLQLHNATVIKTLDQLTGANGYRITQNMNSNTLSTDFTANLYPGVNTDSWLYGLSADPNIQIPLDFPVDDVTNEMVVEATRLTIIPISQKRYAACTEVLVRDEYYSFEYDHELDSWDLNSLKYLTYIGVVNPPTFENVSEALHKLDFSSKFASAPLQRMLISQENTATGYTLPKDNRLISDVTNFTTISVETLRTMHNACLISILTPALPANAGTGKRR